MAPEFLLKISDILEEILVTQLSEFVAKFFDPFQGI